MEKIEIIKKIEQLFYTKTFKEVSLQEIADEIGMKKASLYYHFPSKEAIISEVIQYSFENYFKFILYITKQMNENQEKYIQDFIYYPEKNKNVFSIINQNGYCDSPEIIALIEEKQKIIFEHMCQSLQEQAQFTREKTFLFLSIMQDIWRKKCLYGACDIDKDLLISQIKNIFFS